MFLENNTIKYYKFTYYDDYRSLYLPIDSDLDIVLESYKNHYNHTAHKLTYQWIPYKEDKGEKFADFPNPFSSYFLLSKRAWGLLQDVIKDDVIFIEINSPADNYCAVQLKNNPECFLPDSSEYVYFSSDASKRARVKKLALDKTLLPNAQIFLLEAHWSSLPGVRGSLIVSQTVAEIVTLNNLTGGFFEEVMII